MSQQPKFNYAAAAKAKQQQREMAISEKQPPTKPKETKPAEAEKADKTDKSDKTEKSAPSKQKKEFNPHAFFTGGGASTQPPQQSQPAKAQKQQSGPNNNTRNSDSLRLNAQPFNPQHQNYRPPQSFQPRGSMTQNSASRPPQQQRSPQPPQQQLGSQPYYTPAYNTTGYYDPNMGIYVPFAQAPAAGWSQYPPQMPPTSPSAPQVSLPATTAPAAANAPRNGPSPQNIPTTPRVSSSNASPRPPFTPSANAPIFSPPQSTTTSPPPTSGMSPSAASFMPQRKSAAIKISNAQGEKIDLTSFKHQRQSSSIPSIASVEASAPDPSTYVKPPPRTAIRLESEEAKAKRLAEEAKQTDSEEKKKQEKANEERIETSRKEEEKKEAEAEEKKRQEAAAEKAKAEEKLAAEEKAKADKEANAEKLAKEQAALLAKEKETTEGTTPGTSLDQAKVEISKDEQQKELISKIAPATDELATPAESDKQLPKIDTSSPTVGEEEKPAAASPSTSTQKPSQALGAARRIDDLTKISYPGDIKSPKAELNKQARPGKFRYDRDFLMQFMSVFTDKPASMPSLDAIGLEPDQGMGFGGRSSSGRQGSRGGMGRSSGFGKQGGFGQFSDVSSRGTSSAERFARSQAAGAFAGQPMSRTNSSHRGMAREASGGGRNRSQRGKTRDGKGGQSATPLADAMGSVAPLEKSENAWTPQALRNRAQGVRPGLNVDENDPAYIEKKVKGLLNKLTIEKFEPISDQIIIFANKSENEDDGRTLRLVIKLVFEKATDEAVWSEMYARLCRKMYDQLSANISDKDQPTTTTGGRLFRKYLLTRCQEDFEKGWSDKAAASKAAAEKAAEDDAKRQANEEAEADIAKGGEPKADAQSLSDEYYAAQKAKRRGLGLVRFIGELFKLTLLTAKVMHLCIMQLLQRDDTKEVEEEDIESLAKLLTTVGGMLETPEAKRHIDSYFSHMQDIVDSPKTSSRLQFMLLDVIELRNHNWVGRHKDAGPKSIAQIHRDAAKQRAQSAADANVALQRGSSGRGPARQESSRGPSRRGQPRAPAVPEEKGGGDGWNTIGSGGNQKTSQVAGNLSQFGQFSSKGAQQPQQSQQSQFGPTSVFTKKGRQGGSGGTSPSGVASPLLSEGKSPAVSRTNSSGNMFSLLEAQDQAQHEEQPQRKKLNLLPRSSTKTDVEEPEPAPAAPATEEITDEKAKQMVKTMIEEFYSLKKISEGLESFKELPEEHKPKLIEQLIDRSLNGKKETVDITSELITAAVEQELVAQTQLETELVNILEFIEDISIDVPNAYEYSASLIKASKFDSNGIDRLLAKIPKSDSITQPSDKVKKYL
ncbi:hypothetical protein WALSEDRAFT_32440 [Wallemia mellicola CBS 633.66]|uniref:MI domain-containing protein n=1 Tax=Wallemia mellicola (strain ATCC MYA-4683 / CBS 633.66) TaxID=671144 RepID=I4YD55_WALMC|nr:hypothetical protein WALSEDRAFT_32440 [Wallemia mellicola CBS 633.66]EIM21897.1 hypothetical protein WALSEDRAFT_32440 [Wallemia mellicola CBS 633.66]TIB89681.1 hypothetical protein E3Q19_02988 [Wallemia mellicola]|eukprot:XP_006958195.1 hypothetical protein WALSEDRAFT_32440 [Wallemia mellicola CBS 633.66]